MVRPYTLSINVKSFCVQVCQTPQMHVCFFYFTVAALLLTRDFLPLHHFTPHIKDMRQRIVGIGCKHSNIYQKAYQLA